MAADSMEGLRGSTVGAVGLIVLRVGTRMPTPDMLQLNSFMISENNQKPFCKYRNTTWYMLVFPNVASPNDA